MDFNPMMLIPFLMQNKNGAEATENAGQPDMSKLLAMLSAMKGGQSANPADIIGMLGGDNPQLKSVMEMINATKPKADNQTAPPKDDKTEESHQPSFAANEINEALHKMLKR